MNWHVIYNTMRDGRVEFNHDEAIGPPFYKPEGKTPEEAIESVREYLVEIYACNCFSSRPIKNGLELIDPSDQEVIERYTDFSAEPYYVLIGTNGKPYESSEPGQLGGHRRLKIYGRLDCPSANRAIKKGQYVNTVSSLRMRLLLLQPAIDRAGFVCPKSINDGSNRRKRAGAELGQREP